MLASVEATTSIPDFVEPVLLRDLWRDASYVPAAATLHDEDRAAYVANLAHGGNAAAQNAMGYRSLMGLGAAEDTGEALAGFERAHANGEPVAGYNLGVMHLKGLGGAPKNESKAAQYFEKAYRLGVWSAADALASMLYTGSGVPMDQDRARCVLACSVVCSSARLLLVSSCRSEQSICC